MLFFLFFLNHSLYNFFTILFILSQLLFLFILYNIGIWNKPGSSPDKSGSNVYGKGSGINSNNGDESSGDKSNVVDVPLLMDRMGNLVLAVQSLFNQQCSKVGEITIGECTGKSL